MLGIDALDENPIAAAGGGLPVNVSRYTLVTAPTSNFQAYAALHNAPFKRQLLISDSGYTASSDYSAFVTAWPQISQVWNNVNPSTVVIDLSNDAKTFDFLFAYPNKMKNACELKLGFQFMQMTRWSDDWSKTGWSANLCTVSSDALGNKVTKDTAADSSTLQQQRWDDATALAGRRFSLRATLSTSASQVGSVNAALRILSEGSFPQSVNSVSFGTGDGSTTSFQLTDSSGQTVMVNSIASIYANDWQGVTELSPTSHSNELLYSSVFSTGASWNYVSSLAILADAFVSPNGGNGYVITDPSTTTFSFLNQNIALSSYSNLVKMSALVKQDSIPTTTRIPIFRLWFVDSSFASVANFDITFATDSGVALARSASGVSSQSFQVESLSNVFGNFWKITMFAACNSASAYYARFALYPAASVGSLGSPYAATATGSVGLWGALLAQNETTTGRHIETSTVALSIPDYVQSINQAVLPVAPNSGATLNWSGVYDGYSKDITLTTTQTEYKMTVVFPLDVTSSGLLARIDPTGTTSGSFMYGNHAMLSEGYGTEPYVVSSGDVPLAEFILAYAGQMDSIQYNAGRASLAIADKFMQLAQRVAGTATSAVDYTSSNYLVHDMAWYLCTSHGGFSAITSTSNPDIDYESFSSWSSLFSSDNTRFQGNFTGQKVVELLQKVSNLTQSSIYKKNGKIAFSRFLLSDTPGISFTDDNVIDVTATLDFRTLINQYDVGAAYNVSSASYAVTVTDISSASVGSYGLYQDNSMETDLWLVDSTSALNLAQRMITTYKDVFGSYEIAAPLVAPDKSIGDTLIFTDQELNVSGQTYRIMEEVLDMENGLKRYTVNQTQLQSVFKLDFSALDSSDVLP